MTNILVKEGSRWPWFLYSSLYSMGFGIESPPILFLLMVFGLWFLVENTLYFNVVGKRIAILFKGFTSHEFVMVCKILQSLQTNTK